MEERKFVCHFCNKNFASGKALGGHIRIHSKENSVASYRYNGSKKKRLVSQREMMTLKQQQQQQEQVSCRECGKGFVSLKALSAHRADNCEGEKMLIDSQSDTETSSPPTRKRSKRVMRQSNSESFSYESSSSDSGIDPEVKSGASNLMKLSSDTSFKKRRNLVMNSLGESSDNNSVIVETKSSSGEELNVKNHVFLETDKVADDDQLGSADDDGVILCDSNDSDSDYYMNGPKKSDSDISVDGSFKNTGFGSGFNNSLNRFRNSDDGGGPKYELSKRRRVFSSYETDSCADTNSKIHRFRDSKSPIVRKAGGEKKKSKGHECPICFKMFKSGQALGGHKRSHSIGNQVVEMRNQIDLNLPASDSDE